MQFDEKLPPTLRAPQFAECTDDILRELGRSEDEIIQLKVDGASHLTTAVSDKMTVREPRGALRDEPDDGDRFVAAVRRTIAIVAFLAPLIVVGPAGAHACAAPVQVEVGEPSTITVGITAEDAALASVDVEVPAGFVLDAAGVFGASGQGWEIDESPSLVTFRGGQVPPYSCAYVFLVGTATERGVLAFPLVVHGTDGTTRRFGDTTPYHPESAQMVYVGVELPGPPVPEPDSGVDVLGAAGWLLLGVGAVGLIGWGLPRTGRRLRFTLPRSRR